MDHNGITVDTLLNDEFHAGFIPPRILLYSNAGADAYAYTDADVSSTCPCTLFSTLLAVEVVNLSRNIIITSDKFSVVEYNLDLSISIPSKQTSVKGW